MNRRGASRPSWSTAAAADAGVAGTFPETLAALRTEAQAAGHRRMVVVSGAPDACRVRAAEAVSSLPPAAVAWFGSVPPADVAAVAPERAAALLGREFDAVVFDLHGGFDADAFGALSGTIRGGGLLLLLTPPLAVWAAEPDPRTRRIAPYPFGPEAVGGRFIERFIRLLRSAPGVLQVVAESGECTGWAAPPPATPPPPAGPDEAPLSPEVAAACRTADQRRAVARLLHLRHGHRHRPLVLTADRGRGKSTALGLAAAQLLREGTHRILVTAPRLAATEPLFAALSRRLPEAECGRGRRVLASGELRFLPPDELLRTTPSADLLLVDEAAAIPSPLLTRLLRHYPRIAFATTVHGYEGTGRGFALRFRETLDRETPGWQAEALETPVRWRPGDPLEALVFRSLCLDADSAPDAAVAVLPAGACRPEQVDRTELARDEEGLRQLFGLLVQAHYRTTPTDLRRMLDAPGVSVWVVRHAGTVIATAVVDREGGIPEPLAEAVFAGCRRLQGHLLAQSLAAHAGLERAPVHRFVRILRLAVHPAAQRRGVGRALVEAIAGAAAAEGVDALGASFGADPALLTFWARADMHPVWLGLRRGQSSGHHSAMVLRPLSSAGASLFAAARERFHHRLPVLLGEPLRDLEPVLAHALLQEVRLNGPPALELAERRELCAFAFARRGYEVSLPLLRLLALYALRDPTAPLTPEMAELLVRRVLQQHGWSAVAAATGHSGREAVLHRLRVIYARLMRHYGLAEACGSPGCSIMDGEARQ